MFALSVSFLTGRYAAAQYFDRGSAEWPPHPARLYSALVAVWAQGGRSKEEAEALRWLAQQGAPHLVASEADERTMPVVFVPVNDSTAVGSWYKQAAALEEAQRVAEVAPDNKARKAAERAVASAEKSLLGATQRSIAADGKGSAAIAADSMRLLPTGRPKQPRQFPSVVPDRPQVRFQWPQAEPDDQTAAALDRVTARVSRLGHSSSLVAVSMDRDQETPTWVPDDEGALMVRTPLPDQFDHLEAAYALHQGVEGRLLPFQPTRYRTAAGPPAPEAGHREFGRDWLVLEWSGGPRVSLSDLVPFTQAIRGALLRHADQPVSPVVSGHGLATGQGHLAILGLPFVGREHADGHLLGAAIALPSTRSDADRVAVLRAIGRWRQHNGLAVKLGRAGVVQLRWTPTRSPRQTLRASTWTRASTLWASVTPVALDRNPGRLGDRNPERAEEAADAARSIVAKACKRAGLPDPVSVEVSSASTVVGVPGTRKFGPFPRGERRSGKPQRVLSHVVLQFDAPVRGPVLLGAGRFLGLGLFRPVAGP